MEGKQKMKISAVILAAAIAAPACASDWAPRANMGTLSAIEVPAPAPAAKAGPKDGQNYSGAEELLIKEFGITAISMDIPEAEVMRQDRFYNNAFCFEHALRLALFSLLEDYSDPTSPLAKELAAIGALEAPTKSELRRARQNLMDSLNRGSSMIALVRPYKLYQPPKGETVERNWILFLRVNGSSYWAVVERSGEKPAYVYGG